MVRYEMKNTPMGAGATMSFGKKARELTKTSVNKNIAKIISGAMY
jgi:hypothetical protein